MDDIDIYGDLDEFHEEEQRKSKELLALETKYNEALQTIEAMKLEKKDLRKKIRIMEQNLQSLLDTAKAEIKRKDKMIDALRKEKDDICFRRQRVQSFPKAANEDQFSPHGSTMPKTIVDSNLCKSENKSYTFESKEKYIGHGDLKMKDETRIQSKDDQRHSTSHHRRRDESNNRNKDDNRHREVDKSFDKRNSHHKNLRKSRSPTKNSKDYSKIEKSEKLDKRKSEENDKRSTRNSKYDSKDHRFPYDKNEQKYEARDRDKKSCSIREQRQRDESTLSSSRDRKRRRSSERHRLKDQDILSKNLLVPPKTTTTIELELKYIEGSDDEPNGDKCSTENIIMIEKNGNGESNVNQGYGKAHNNGDRKKSKVDETNKSTHNCNEDPGMNRELKSDMKIVTKSENKSKLSKSKEICYKKDDNIRFQTTDKGDFENTTDRADVTNEVINNRTAATIHKRSTFPDTETDEENCKNALKVDENQITSDNCTMLDLDQGKHPKTVKEGATLDSPELDLELNKRNARKNLVEERNGKQSNDLSGPNLKTSLEVLEDASEARDISTVTAMNKDVTESQTEGKSSSNNLQETVENKAWNLQTEIEDKKDAENNKNCNGNKTEKSLKISNDNSVETTKTNQKVIEKPIRSLDAHQKSGTEKGDAEITVQNNEEKESENENSFFNLTLSSDEEENCTDDNGELEDVNSQTEKTKEKIEIIENIRLPTLFQLTPKTKNSPRKHKKNVKKKGVKEKCKEETVINETLPLVDITEESVFHQLTKSPKHVSEEKVLHQIIEDTEVSSHPAVTEQNNFHTVTSENSSSFHSTTAAIANEEPLKQLTNKNEILKTEECNEILISSDNSNSFHSISSTEESEMENNIKQPHKEKNSPIKVMERNSLIGDASHTLDNSSDKLDSKTVKKPSQELESDKKEHVSKMASENTAEHRRLDNKNGNTTEKTTSFPIQVENAKESGSLNHVFMAQEKTEETEVANCLPSKLKRSPLKPRKTQSPNKMQTRSAKIPDPAPNQIMNQAIKRKLSNQNSLEEPKPKLTKIANTSADVRAMLIDGKSPQLTNDVILSSSLTGVHDTNLDELERDMLAIFQSPRKFDTTLPPTNCDPSANSTQLNAIINTCDRDCDSSVNGSRNVSLASDSSFDSKRLSLGSSQYVVERVSENVVNVVITRRRGKKRPKLLDSQNGSI